MAMARLIGMRDKFDVAFANDTDADRHGIVTGSNGLMNPNHYLAAAVRICSSIARAGTRAARGQDHRQQRGSIDRLAAKNSAAAGRDPGGLKWFVDGLGDGSFGFAGEESAGASFLRRDGTVWTTDKDGIHSRPAGRRDRGANRQGPSQLFGNLTA